MPRTGLSSEELKQAAVQSALNRIRAVGFDKVRLSDVAKDIGVSDGAVYGHLTGNAALLGAVVGGWVQENGGSRAKVLGRSGSPQDRIVEWFVTLYRMKRRKALEDPEPHRAFDIASALEKPFVVAHLDTLIGQLIQLFSDLQPQTPGETEAKARLVYAATACFHHPTLVAQSARDDLEPQLREILMLVLRGMEAEAEKAQ